MYIVCVLSRVYDDVSPCDHGTCPIFRSKLSPTLGMLHVEERTRQYDKRSHFQNITIQIIEILALRYEELDRVCIVQIQRRNLVLDRVDCSSQAATWARSYRSWTYLPWLADLNHEVGIDFLSEVCERLPDRDYSTEGNRPKSLPSHLYGKILVTRAYRLKVGLWARCRPHVWNRASLPPLPPTAAMLKRIRWRIQRCWPTNVSIWTYRHKW